MPLELPLDDYLKSFPEEEPSRSLARLYIEVPCANCNRAGLRLVRKSALNTKTREIGTAIEAIDMTIRFELNEGSRIVVFRKSDQH